jgi:hypothetical protein
MSTNSTTEIPPLSSFIAAGHREFEAVAERIAIIERTADIVPGSFVQTLNSLCHDTPEELAGFIAGGWEGDYTGLAEKLRAALPRE